MPDRTRSPWAFPLVVVIALVALAAPVVFGHAAASDYRLADPDAYMWLLRVEALHAAGAWFDATVPAIDAPYGEANHWGRLFDVYLLTGALALEPFMGSFRDALYAWAFVACPVLLVAALGVFTWGSRPLMGTAQVAVAGALMLIQPLMGLSFQFGRADHHGLFLLLFIGQLALLVRLFFGGRRHHAALGGVLLGLALWVGVEALVMVLFFGAALGLRVLRRADDDGRALADWMGAAALTAAVAIVVQRPPELWLEPFSSSLSIYHPAALALGWLAVTLVRRPLRGAAGWPRRAALLGGAGVAAGAAMALLYPGFFTGPLGDFDESVVRPWLDQIGEFQPLWPNTLERLQGFLLHIGPGLISLGYMVLRWRKAGPHERDTFLVLGLGLILYSALALDAVRWAMYLGALNLFVWPLPVIAVTRRLMSLWEHLRSPLPVLARLLTATAGVLAVTVGPHLIATAAVAATGNTEEGKAPGCDWSDAADALGRLRQAGAIGPQGIVLSHTFQGPELAWRSGLGAVGAPYGNARSLTETRTILTATDDDGALAQLRRRGVDHILLCAGDAEIRWYRAAKGAEPTLADRLLADTPPQWAAPLSFGAGEVAARLDEQFTLYRVTGSGR